VDSQRGFILTMPWTKASCGHPVSRGNLVAHAKARQATEHRQLNLKPGLPLENTRCTSPELAQRVFRRVPERWTGSCLVLSSSVLLVPSPLTTSASFLAVLLVLLVRPDRLLCKQLVWSGLTSRPDHTGPFRSLSRAPESTSYLAGPVESTVGRA
jgi:hypothetical protein